MIVIHATTIAIIIVHIIIILVIIFDRSRYARLEDTVQLEASRGRQKVIMTIKTLGDPTHKKGHLAPRLHSPLA